MGTTAVTSKKKGENTKSIDESIDQRLNLRELLTPPPALRKSNNDKVNASLRNLLRGISDDDGLMVFLDEEKDEEDITAVADVSKSQRYSNAIKYYQQRYEKWERKDPRKL